MCNRGCNWLILLLVTNKPTLLLIGNMSGKKGSNIMYKSLEIAKKKT